MNKFMVIGVDSSISIKAKVLYFKYKGNTFSYKPRYEEKITDDFVGCFTDKRITPNEMYKTMTEFLSALAFAHDAKIIPHPVAHLPKVAGKSIKEVSYFASRPRSIEAIEIVENFVTISKLSTPVQINLARLYRTASAKNDVHARCLFFWHTLVYPSEKDIDAVNYINNICNNLPNELNHFSRDIELICNTPYFSAHYIGQDKVGNYIYSNIRNPIAHIVRSNDSNKSLDLDCLGEEQHLSHVSNLLYVISRYKLKNDYHINDICNADDFHYI